jgi:hypothetical protein
MSILGAIKRPSPFKAIHVGWFRRQHKSPFFHPSPRKLCSQRPFPVLLEIIGDAACIHTNSFSKRKQLRRVGPSGLQRHVLRRQPDVSEEYIAYISRIEKFSLRLSSPGFYLRLCALSITVFISNGYTAPLGPGLWFSVLWSFDRR